MTDNKNAAASTAPYSSLKQQTANQKHSNLFYISNSLFQNKWLKQQRCIWLEARKRNYRKKKFKYLKKLATLKADVTIDLLSDDEAQIDDNHLQQLEQQAPMQTQFQHFPNAATTMQISQVPNITLIPVQKMQTAALPKALKKNKRKARPRKRLPTPLDCTESIVLTDDDDEGKKEEIQITLQQPVANLQPLPTVETKPVPLFTQVDEEVSVSLVPRSKPSGTCSSSHKNVKTSDTVFPMLPDETTVHTVIANRIYELSLSKLREGLATCGIPEFADEQQRLSAKSRRKTTFAPPIATPPPAPVSLKLSSDLSISLISDDEPEDDVIMLGKLSPSLKIRTMYAAEIQQRVEVQQQSLSIIHGETDARQKPRKRKLG